MTCACLGGHGPGCVYYTPFCMACGENIAGKSDLHACPSIRHCGRCGAVVSGLGISTHTHHICPAIDSRREVLV